MLIIDLKRSSDGNFPNIPVSSLESDESNPSLFLEVLSPSRETEFDFSSSSVGYLPSNEKFSEPQYNFGKMFPQDVQQYEKISPESPEICELISSDFTKKDLASSSEQHETVDLQLYDDLLSKEYVDQEEGLKMLQERCHSLLSQNKSLTERSDYLLKDVNKLKLQNSILLKNISALFETAKMELQRKNDDIMSLRRELDQMVFRRMTRQKPEHNSNSIHVFGKNTTENYDAKVIYPQKEKEICDSTTVVQDHITTFGGPSYIGETVNIGVTMLPKNNSDFIANDGEKIENQNICPVELAFPNRTILNNNDIRGNILFGFAESVKDIHSCDSKPEIKFYEASSQMNEKMTDKNLQDLSFKQKVCSVPNSKQHNKPNSVKVEPLSQRQVSHKIMTSNQYVLCTETCENLVKGICPKKNNSNHSVELPNITSSSNNNGNMKGNPFFCEMDKINVVKVKDQKRRDKFDKAYQKSKYLKSAHSKEKKLNTQTNKTNKNIDKRQTTISCASKGVMQDTNPHNTLPDNLINTEVNYIMAGILDVVEKIMMVNNNVLSEEKQDLICQMTKPQTEGNFDTSRTSLITLIEKTKSNKLQKKVSVKCTKVLADLEENLDSVKSEQIRSRDKRKHYHNEDKDTTLCAERKVITEATTAQLSKQKHASDFSSAMDEDTMEKPQLTKNRTQSSTHRTLKENQPSDEKQKKGSHQHSHHSMALSRSSLQHISKGNYNKKSLVSTTDSHRRKSKILGKIESSRKYHSVMENFQKEIIDADHSTNYSTKSNFCANKGSIIEDTDKSRPNSSNGNCGSKDVTYMLNGILDGVENNMRLNDKNLKQEKDNHICEPIEPPTEGNFDSAKPIEKSSKEKCKSNYHDENLIKHVEAPVLEKEVHSLKTQKFQTKDTPTNKSKLQKGTISHSLIIKESTITPLPKRKRSSSPYRKMSSKKTAVENVLNKSCKENNQADKSLRAHEKLKYKQPSDNGHKLNSHRYKHHSVSIARSSSQYKEDKSIIKPSVSENDLREKRYRVSEKCRPFRKSYHGKEDVKSRIKKVVRDFKDYRRKSKMRKMVMSPVKKVKLESHCSEIFSVKKSKLENHKKRSDVKENYKSRRMEERVKCRNVDKLKNADKFPSRPCEKITKDVLVDAVNSINISNRKSSVNTCRSEGKCENTSFSDLEEGELLSD